MLLAKIISRTNGARLKKIMIDPTYLEFTRYNLYDRKWVKYDLLLQKKHFLGLPNLAYLILYHENDSGCL